MPYKDPNRQREYQRQWDKDNREKRRAYRARKRLEVIEFLGGKCVYCGCNIPKALEINHINGGGQEERRRRKTRDSYGFHLDILAGRRTTEDLELTCIACNAWHKAVHLKQIYDGWTIKWESRNLFI